jgi:glycosyltransferase involved in cell wall biosynthesis
MRIGLDISSVFPPRTGMGNYTLGLVRELVAQNEDDEFHLFLNSLRRPTPAEAEFAQSRVQVHRRRWPGPLLLSLWQLAEWPAIESFVGEVDLFHAPASYVPPQKKGLRVTTLHDLWFLENQAQCDTWGGKYHRRRLAKVMDQLDGVIAVSAFTAQQATELLGLPAERIFTIHSGVDERFQPPTDEARGQPPLDAQGGQLPHDFILTVSTIEPRKNMAGLLDAYRQLLERRPDAPPLVVAGMTAKWEGETKWRELLTQPPLNERVIVTGYIPEEQLPALYGAAQLFVLPSFCEGFGFPVLEAMACGTPVVCSRGSALDEIGGEAALRFDPHNAEEMSEALERALTDEALRRECAAKGFKQAAKFTWAECARQTRAAYQQLIEQK